MNHTHFRDLFIFYVCTIYYYYYFLFPHTDSTHLLIFSVDKITIFVELEGLSADDRVLSHIS